MLKWSSSGITNSGAVRTFNEDAFLNNSASGLWAVADGMGGHDAGDYASTMIVDELSKLVPDSEFNDAVSMISTGMKSVNLALIDEAKKRNMALIGSTAVVLLARDSQFACMWAGDSRLYRLRQGVLEQISRDHSEVQSLVDHGQISKAEAVDHPSSNVITRAVGAVETLQLDKVYSDLQANDKFLLCSDGLYKEVSEQEMTGALNNNEVPSHTAQELLQLALERGARDNVTLVVVNFFQDS